MLRPLTVTEDRKSETFWASFRDPSTLSKTWKKNMLANAREMLPALSPDSRRSPTLIAELHIRSIPPQNMGKGGEGRHVPVKDGLMKRISSSGKLKSITSVADDLLVLKSIWFNKASGDDHAERLESFYGPQAEACKLLPAMPVCSDWHAPPLDPLR